MNMEVVDILFNIQCLIHSCWASFCACLLEILLGHLDFCPPSKINKRYFCLDGSIDHYWRMSISSYCNLFTGCRESPEKKQKYDDFMCQLLYHYKCTTVRFLRFFLFYSSFLLPTNLNNVILWGRISEVVCSGSIDGIRY